MDLKMAKGRINFNLLQLKAVIDVLEKETKKPKYKLFALEVKELIEKKEQTNSIDELYKILDSFLNEMEEEKAKEFDDFLIGLYQIRKELNPKILNKDDNPLLGESLLQTIEKDLYILEDLIDEDIEAKYTEFIEDFKDFIEAVRSAKSQIEEIKISEEYKGFKKYFEENILMELIEIRKKELKLNLKQEVAEILDEFEDEISVTLKAKITNKQNKLIKEIALIENYEQLLITSEKVQEFLDELEDKFEDIDEDEDIEEDELENSGEKLKSDFKINSNVSKSSEKELNPIVSLFVFLFILATIAGIGYGLFVGVKAGVNFVRGIDFPSIRLFSRPSKVEFGDLNIKYLAEGDGHLLILTDDNQVYAYGSNYYHQLGLDHGWFGQNETINKITNITSNFSLDSDDYIIKVGAYHSFSLALSNKGNLFIIGEIDPWTRYEDVYSVNHELSLVGNETITDFQVFGKTIIVLTSNGRVLTHDEVHIYFSENDSLIQNDCEELVYTEGYYLENDYHANRWYEITRIFALDSGDYIKEMVGSTSTLLSSSGRVFMLFSENKMIYDITSCLNLSVGEKVVSLNDGGSDISLITTSNERILLHGNLKRLNGQNYGYKSIGVIDFTSYIEDSADIIKIINHFYDVIVLYNTGQIIAINLENSSNISSDFININEENYNGSGIKDIYVSYYGALYGLNNEGQLFFMYDKPYWMK